MSSSVRKSYRYKWRFLQILIIVVIILRQSIFIGATVTNEVLKAVYVSV